MQDFEGVFFEVERNLATRKPEHMDNVLPMAFTTRRMRHLRKLACQQRDEALDCAAWSSGGQLRPWPPIQADGSPVAGDPPRAYVCKGCKHPRVPLRQFQPQGGPQSARTWQRYLDGEVPMAPEAFQRAIVHSVEQGWLTSLHANFWLTEAFEREAVTLAYRRVAARRQESPAYWEQKGEVFFREAVEQETQRELQVQEGAATALLDQVLKSPDYPDELKALVHQVQFPHKEEASP